MKHLITAAALATLLAASQGAIAQPAGSLLSIWAAGGDGSGAGDWDTASNWNPAAIPNVLNEDSAVINGGGTATVSGAVSAVAGGLVLGQNAGDVGVLSVVPGGSIAFDEDLQFPADGSVRVGQDGLGTLTMTGGSLTSISLTSAGEAGSLVSLSGSASLSAGSATLARTTRIAGSGVGLATTGALVFTGTHSLVPEITGASHSTIDVGSVATLGGTLDIEFNGYTPLTTDTWDLLTASTVVGAFSAVNVTGAEFASGQALGVRTVDSGGDKLVQLFLEQQLVLDVNRATGVVTITNPGDATVQFDGYSVRSAGGALDQGAWDTLAGQVGAGWVAANPSATALNELVDGSGSTAIAAGGSLTLGPVYQPAPPTEFGAELDDVVFQYTRPGAGNVAATVQYSGPELINELVLYVDPSTGEATLRNASPFGVAIEAYTITSDSGALSTAWDSLDDQDAEAGAWQEANPSATRVSELMDGGETAMAIHRSFDLGTLVNGGAEDLTFEYLLAGDDTSRAGVVVYEAAPAQVALPGDYNDDGAVDAADYTVWRDALGTTTVLPGDTSPGGVSPVDYAVWANNYGATLPGAVAVPEPASLLLLLVGAAFARNGRRHAAV